MGKASKAKGQVQSPAPPALALPLPDLPRPQGCLTQVRLQGDAVHKDDGVTGIHWQYALPNLHSHLGWAGGACVFRLPEMLTGTGTQAGGRSGRSPSECGFILRAMGATEAF